MNLSEAFLTELKTSKIFVAGHRGLVGSAMLRRLKSLGCENIITRTSEELDLRRQNLVEAFFEKEKPQIVFLAAAHVGGIIANDTYRAEFIYDNLMIASNVIDASYRSGVKRLLNFCSSCVYPKLAPQPLKEEYLLTSALEQTNEPYALAKISALKLIESYNRQYKTSYMTVMPTSLYGICDNFNPAQSHVIPGMIRKFHDAKLAKASTVTLWGTGEVYREFLYCDDVSKACLVVLDRTKPGQFPGDYINIGTGIDLTIKELANHVRETVGFEGQIVWDSTKPNGTPKKQMDISRIDKLGWKPTTSLATGLKLAYQWFLENEC